MQFSAGSILVSARATVKVKLFLNIAGVCNFTQGTDLFAYTDKLTSERSGAIR
jgi:hypothetical protein